jgi:hypothetical protein
MVVWETHARLLRLPGETPYEDALSRIERESPDWLIVTRAAVGSRSLASYYVVKAPAVRARVDSERAGEPSARLAKSTLGWALKLQANERALVVASPRAFSQSRFVEVAEESPWTRGFPHSPSPEQQQQQYKQQSQQQQSYGPPPAIGVAVVCLGADGAPASIGFTPSPPPPEQQQQQQVQQQIESLEPRNTSFDDFRSPASTGSAGPSVEDRLSGSIGNAGGGALNNLTESTIAAGAIVGGALVSGAIVAGLERLPSPAPAAQDANEILLTISGQADEEVAEYHTAILDFRVEPAEAAEPLPGQQKSAKALPRRRLRAFLSLHGPAECRSPKYIEFNPPGPGVAIQDAFELSVLAPGEIVAVIYFRQGNKELADLTFKIRAVPWAGPKVPLSSATTQTSASVTAEDLARDSGHDPGLEMIIEERSDGAHVKYQYTLLPRNLDLGAYTFESPPLLAAGGKVADVGDYIKAVYARVAAKVSGDAELAQLEVETRAMGLQLAEELLDPDFVRLVWPYRQQIRTIRVISHDHLIPWELLRMRFPSLNPAERAQDDKYLCEYGLIRQSLGQAPPAALRLVDWSCLEGRYQNASRFESVAGHTAGLLELLKSRGLSVKRIEPTWEDVRAAMLNGNFDVLHIACHGEADIEEPITARLIIGERMVSGSKSEPITITPAIGVDGSPEIARRRPLVFLDACKSSLESVTLTAWGGWPSAFFGLGAGSFVGAAWPIRTEPAAAFSKAFYEALLDRKTLVEATQAGRAAARTFKDSSWLAYRVFGDPTARRAD